MKLKKIQAVLWLEVALICSAWAPNVQADHLHLDEIDVVTDAVPIENRSKASEAGDTAKLFADEAGVSFYRGGGVSSLPAIRGLADDRVRVQVDGMDLISSCANHMNPPLSYIAPSNVEALSVFKGISPVSYGGDSIAGTILVNSATPEFAAPDEGLLTSASINTFYKSNNDARGVNINASVANEDVYFRYTGSNVEANNYHAGGNFKPAGAAAMGKGWLDGDEVGSTYYRSINHALALGVKRDNHLIEAKISLQDIPEQGFVNQRMDMTGNTARQFNLKYKGDYDWGKLEAQAYHERVRHRMQFGDDKQFWYQSGAAPGMPMDTLGKTSGLKIKGTMDISDRDLLRVGAEYQRYRLDDYWGQSGPGMMMGPNTFWNINDAQRDRYDVFAEVESQWSQQWMTLVGLRSSTVKMGTDEVQGYNNSTMPMGMMGMMASYGVAANNFNAADRSETDHNIDITTLAQFTPSKAQRYEVGYAMKTRSPNVYERFAWADTNTMVMNMNNWFGDGNGYVGNLDLDPETAHTISLTGQWNDAADENWQLQASPYFTYVHDYIDAVSCASVGKTCMMRSDGFSNLSLDNQSAKLYGIDIQAKKLLASNAGLGRFTATALLSYVRGKNTKANDDLYNIMPLNAKLGVVHKLGAWKNHLELKMVAEKDKVQAIRNEVKTRGYSLVNFYSSYEWKQARVDFGVENIFDKEYADPLGGAYLGQGATMGRGVPHGTLVPGMGRSVNVGLTLFY